MTSDKLYAHTNVSADDFPSSFLTLLLIHCRLILACGQWNVFRLISRQVGARTMAQRFDDVIIILHISYVVCFTHDDMKLFFLVFPFPMNSSMAKTTANRSWKLCRWIKNFRLFLLTFLTLLDPRPLAQMKTNMKQISCCVLFRNKYFLAVIENYCEKLFSSLLFHLARPAVMQVSRSHFKSNLSCYFCVSAAGRTQILIARTFSLFIYMETLTTSTRDVIWRPS